jgi:hypothetical protein
VSVHAGASCLELRRGPHLRPCPHYALRSLRLYGKEGACTYIGREHDESRVENRRWYRGSKESTCGPPCLSLSYSVPSVGNPPCLSLTPSLAVGSILLYLDVVLLSRSGTCVHAVSYLVKKTPCKKNKNGFLVPAICISVAPGISSKITQRVARADSSKRNRSNIFCRSRTRVCQQVTSFHVATLTIRLPVHS